MSSPPDTPSRWSAGRGRHDANLTLDRYWFHGRQKDGEFPGYPLHQPVLVRSRCAARGLESDDERGTTIVIAPWLDPLPAADTDFDRFAASWPDAFRALSDVVAAAWDETDPVLLELCRLRMATLLGFPAEQARRTARARAAGLEEPKLAELAAWPTSPRFDARERACLTLAEQFVIDANAVTDAHVADVTNHLGSEGCYAFVQALSVVETFQRACLTLGIDTVPDVDQLVKSQPDESPAPEVPQ
jgi:alkylhydroperoxidase family enzyme